jgi:RNA polymerase sigma factor (sigma-70 family)
MESDEARTAWTSLLLLDRLRSGDALAADEVFHRYFERLTSLARGRLSSRVARRTDPEDIVLSVYRSFFVQAREGRYTLTRGGDLWRLLAAITKNKLLRQVRRQTAERRSVDVELPLDHPASLRDDFEHTEPTPEAAVELADELERVLALLDTFGRRVLELRLQGLQIAEIAEDTGRSERSVRRSLARIRELFRERLDDV